MYTLIRLISLRYLLLEQVPAIALSIVIAELFYKFHSFTLECIAFLITWYVIDGGFRLITNALRKPSDRP
jgi:hypothetical protein